MAKRPGQLVCQHLEGISRKALEQYQGIIRDFVRHRHGVYSLYRGSRLYYVGLASNLRSRLRHHLRDRHAGTWDRFSIYITIGDHHLRELEALLLRISFPKGNRQKGKFPRSEDLRRTFLGTVKRFQETERRGLVPGLQIADMDGRLERRKALVEGRTPVLARYVTRPFKLRMDYKDRRLTARVRRDGTIRCRGKVFTSPSLAAIHAMRRPAANGWYQWLYERAPGDWVRLRELRAR